MQIHRVAIGHDRRGLAAAHDVRTLLRKAISGPGIPTLTWSYSYSSNACWASGPTSCAASTSDVKTVTVTKPDGTVDRHLFGNRWRVNEGQLQQVDEGWNGTSALRSTAYRYRQPNGQAYLEQWGTQAVVISDWLAARHRPVDRKVITQQGVTFTWELAANQAGLDAYTRPLTATMSSTLGYSRAETKAYADNTTLWVLGQVASVTGQRRHGTQEHDIQRRPRAAGHLFRIRAAAANLSALPRWDAVPRV